MSAAEIRLKTSCPRRRGRVRTAAAALGLALSMALAACASSEPEYVEKPVEALYNEAMDGLEGGRYTEAQEGFEEVERQHPYSKWATWMIERNTRPACSLKR